MIVLPAIDIYNGNCVRLLKGEFQTAEKVADHYLTTAQDFQNSGAEWIHMVDLDGAKNALPQNSAIFLDVAQNTSLKVEVGGGIRSLHTVDFYLSQGIQRVILGSAAISNPKFVKEAVQKYPERIAVGIDAKNEMVTAEGWVNTSEIHYLELAKSMEQLGVQTIIYTDISKDGTLKGPNFQQLARIHQAVSCNIIASGGVTNREDILKLKDMGLYGAICGKAIYKGTLSLREAIQICK